MGIYKLINEEIQNVLEVGEGTHQAYQWRPTRADSHNYDYEFVTEDGDDYEVVFMDVGTYWNADFKTKQGKFEDVLDKGRFFEVMATVGEIIKDFLIKEGPDVMRISPAKNSQGDTRRFNIYNTFLTKQVPRGYEASTSGGYLYVRKVDELDQPQVAAEGTGDVYAQQKYGIPNAEDQYKQQTQPAITNPEMGELVGYTRRRNNYGGGDNKVGVDYDRNSPIYKNPKSLRNFEEYVRAVSDSKGDLYVGLVNGEYVHGQMGNALGQGNAGVYDIDWGITWQRAANKDVFGLSDSSTSYPQMENENFQNNYEAVQKKSPQFEFSARYFYDLTEVIREELYMLTGNKEIFNEGVGDKYAEEKWGIPDEEQQFTNKGVPDADMGELIMGLVATSWQGITQQWGNIYKNPQSLRGFDDEVRAIALPNGDLYVANQDGDFIHTDMELSLEKKIGFLDDYIEFHRVGDTNEFGASDTLTHKMAEYDLDPYEYIKVLEAKHPQFRFSTDYFQDLREAEINVIIKEAMLMLEGYSSYQEKNEWEKQYQDHLKARSRDNENGELVNRMPDDNGEVINIYRNPTSLRNFGPGVRAISDAEGNLFVGQFDKEYLHQDMADTLGLTQNQYIPWHRMLETNKFNAIDTLIDGDLEQWLNQVKTTNPGMEFHAMDMQQHGY